MAKEVFLIPKTKYVYFDENGEILSIANSKQGIEGNMIEVPMESVKDAISGKDPLFNYCVLYNTQTKGYSVRKKAVDNTFSGYVNENVHEVLESNNDYYDINVIHNALSKQWTVKLHQGIQNVHLNNMELPFSITLKGDPHALLSYFKIRFKDLKEDSKGEVNIPMHSELEVDIENVSVYTFKKFDQYILSVRKDG